MALQWVILFLLHQYSSRLIAFFQIQHFYEKHKSTAFNKPPQWELVEKPAVDRGKEIELVREEHERTTTTGSMDKLSVCTMCYNDSPFSLGRDIIHPRTVMLHHLREK